MFKTQIQINPLLTLPLLVQAQQQIQLAEDRADEQQPQNPTPETIDEQQPLN